ncbi:MAG TPA: trigger factor [bacterium]|nr:trigger factor [bacterium]
MKVEVVDVSKVEKRVEIEVPVERVGDEIEEQYQELKNTAQVKGFRAGKVPRKMLERLFKDYVYEAVIKKLIEETLETALARKSIEPVVEPVLDRGELKPGEAYLYTAHVEVKPAVEIGEYKGIEIEHRDDVVKDQDVDETVQRLAEGVALIKEPPTPRPIKKDDQVTADVSIKEGDKEFKPGDKEEEIELWRETWIPGLHERLAGRGVGDTVTFTAEIEDHDGVPAPFKGKKLDFSFTIKAIKERILPELNDEFAKEYTKNDTLEALRLSIRDSLEEKMNSGNRSRLEAAALESLIKKNAVEVPPSLIKREAMNMAKQFMTRTVRRMPKDEEVEQFSSLFQEEAKKSFEANYLLEAIAKNEGIEATDEEVEERIKKDAERVNMHPDKYQARFGDALQEMTRRQVVLDKALDFLVRSATIKDETDKERK